MARLHTTQSGLIIEGATRLPKRLKLPDIPPASRSLNAMALAHTGFQTTVRPAVYRGRCHALASNPEHHMILEREKQANLAKRNRVKTPVRLDPIDIRSLRSLESRPATQHHRQRKVKSAPEQIWFTDEKRYDENPDISILLKNSNYYALTLRSSTFINKRDENGDLKHSARKMNQTIIRHHTKLVSNNPEPENPLSIKPDIRRIDATGDGYYNQLRVDLENPSGKAPPSTAVSSPRRCKTNKSLIVQLPDMSRVRSSRASTPTSPQGTKDGWAAVID